VLAFCHIPKAAGTSVRQVLRSWYGVGHYDIPQARGRFRFMEAGDIDWIVKRWPGIKSIASHNLSPSNELGSENREVHWFTFLREPVRRYISHYQFYVNRWWGHEKIPFEEWLNLEHHSNTQVKMIAGEANLNRAVALLNERVEVVGLQEEYNDSMLMLAAFTGNYYIPDLIRKRKNIAQSRHIEDKIYGNFDKYEDRILEANELDLELYSYVKDELFPAKKEHFLTGYEVKAEDMKNAAWKMKMNWLVSFLVRNAIRKPLRRKPFRLFGFGNREL